MGIHVACLSYFIYLNSKQKRSWILWISVDRFYSDFFWQIEINFQKKNRKLTCRFCLHCLKVAICVLIPVVITNSLLCHTTVCVVYLMKLKMTLWIVCACSLLNTKYLSANIYSEYKINTTNTNGKIKRQVKETGENIPKDFFLKRGKW